MEVEEEPTVGTTVIPGAECSPRLRPSKTNRGVSVEKLVYPIPTASYLEETWEDEPMTPAGRVFREMNSKFFCVCILGFKHPIDRDKFKSHVELTIMKHKRFTSRVENRNGRPWWTHVHTDVNNHVVEVELSSEEKSDENCVLNYATDVVLQKPFDEGRPLWDMHLVDAKLGEAEECCIVRIHHSLGDGTSLISLLMACTRTVDKPDMVPSVKPVSGDKDLASSQVVTPSFTSRVCRNVCKYLLVLWHSLLEVGKAGATLLWLTDSSTVIKGYAGVEDSPRTYRFVTLNVDDFKYIGKMLGVTINDVFMAMAARGLRHYLEHREKEGFASEEPTNGTRGNQLVQDDSKQKKLLTKKLRSNLSTKLDDLRIRAVALINMRATPGLPELSEMMNGHQSQARWGNHMGYMLLTLPMKLYNDPLKLLQKVKAIGTAKKSSLEGAFSYGFGHLVMRLFGQKVATAIVYRATLQTSISLSNVRGPIEHVMFADNPIVHIVPSVVGHPHGLTLHLQSYSGEITIAAMCTRKLIPDPEYLLELCIEGLEELKKAASEVATKT